MRTKKKYIKLGKPYIEGRKIKVVIEEQSHRESGFGHGATGDPSKKFVASNGVTLFSLRYPDVITSTIYMRGCNTSKDKIPLIFSTLEGYLKFEDAVKEYNEYFGKPQAKEVTMEELHKLLGYEVKIKEGK